MPNSFEVLNLSPVYQEFYGRIKAEYPYNGDCYQGRSISEISDWRKLIGWLRELGLKPSIYRGYGSLTYARIHPGDLFHFEESQASAYATDRSNSFNQADPGILEIDLPSLILESGKKGICHPLEIFSLFPAHANVILSPETNINITREPMGHFIKI